MLTERLKNTDITSDPQEMKLDKTTFLFKEHRPQLLLSDPSKRWLLRKNSRLDALTLDLVDDDNQPHAYKIFLTRDGWLLDNKKDSVPNQISVGSKNSPEQIKALFIYLENYDFVANRWLKKPMTISRNKMLLPTVEQMDHSGQFYNYTPSLTSRPEYKLKNISNDYSPSLDFDVLNSKDFSAFTFTRDPGAIEMNIKCKSINDASIKNFISFLNKTEYRAQFQFKNNDTLRITLGSFKSITENFSRDLRIAMDLDKNTFESILYLAKTACLKPEDELTLISKHVDELHYQDAMNAASSRPEVLFLLGEDFLKKELFDWAIKAYEAIPLPESEYDNRTGWLNISYNQAQFRLGQMALRVNSDEVANQVSAITHWSRAGNPGSQEIHKFLSTIKQKNQNLMLKNKNLEEEVTKLSNKVTNLELNNVAQKNSENENKSHNSEANSSSQALINRTSQGLSAVSSSSSTLPRSDSWEELDMSAEAPRESNNNTNDYFNVNLGC